MLRSSSLQSLASSYAEDDYLDDFGDGIRPKEIQSTLPTLIIDPHDLELFEKFDLKGEALEAELRKHMDSSALMASGPGDLADANREDESSKPIVSIESLGEQNMAANASTTADSSTFSDSSKQQPPHLPIEFKEGNNLAVAVSSATRDLSSMNLESASSYDPLKTAPPSSSLIQEGSGADCAQEPSTAISQLSSACDIVDLSLMSAASPASNLPLMKPIEPKSPEVNPWN